MVAGDVEFLFCFVFCFVFFFLLLEMRDLGKLKSKLEINIVMEKGILDTCQ